MNLRISFNGASRNVTGSCYLVETTGMKILIDCGLFQEHHLTNRNWERFPFNPEDIDVLLLTHAHLDHCGRIPKLVKDGFNGPIYCTSATSDITQIVLRDSAKLQEEDAKFKRKRHQREKRKVEHPVVPLYTIEEAENSFKCFRSIKYRDTIDLRNGVSCEFFDAGHILGSSMIRLKINKNGTERVVIFSGDIGRDNTPILKDPTPFDAADYVIMESTYGDRESASAVNLIKDFSDIVNKTIAAGGNVLIPSFAVERSQEVLYRLEELVHRNLIPKVPIFIDSPMAINVTGVFQNHTELFDEDAAKLLRKDRNLWDLQGLNVCRTSDESKEINLMRDPAIIIAGSGMCTGGRIKHHLVNNIMRPESTVLFVGYQAVGTLGRQLVEGKEIVRILGTLYSVKAKIVRLDGFSAHADSRELLSWIARFTHRKPHTVFLTHGDENAARKLAEKINTQLAIKTVIMFFPAQKKLIGMDSSR